MQYVPQLKKCFRPLLGLFFIEYWCWWKVPRNRILVSVPYWGFFLLNEVVSNDESYGVQFPSPIGAFFYWMRKTKLTGQRRLESFRPLLGLFFIESINRFYKWRIYRVSVPYWGFFLLNPMNRLNQFPVPASFRPLLGLFFIESVGMMICLMAHMRFPSPIGAFFYWIVVECLDLNYINITFPSPIGAFFIE